MRFLRRLRDPVPPVNVRVVHVDGTVTPLDMVYVGVEKRMHVWAPVRMPSMGSGDTIKAGVLPPHTTLTFTTRWRG